MGLLIGIGNAIQLSVRSKTLNVLITEIINALTGETDVSYEDALSELTGQLGAEAAGVIETDLEAILEILGTYVS